MNDEQKLAEAKEALEAIAPKIGAVISGLLNRLAPAVHIENLTINVHIHEGIPLDEEGWGDEDWADNKPHCPCAECRAAYPHNYEDDELVATQPIPDVEDVLEALRANGFNFDEPVADEDKPTAEETYPARKTKAL